MLCILLNTTYVQIVWPRVTKFGTLTHMGKEHVSRGLAVPPSIPTGRGPSIPKLFGSSYILPRGMREQPNFAWLSNSTRGRYYRVNHTTSTGQNFILTRIRADSWSVCGNWPFVVADLFVITFYLRDIVSTVFATVMWLAGCLSHTSIVSKWLNLS